MNLNEANQLETVTEISVDERSSISRSEFYKDYVKKRRPLILRKQSGSCWQIFDWNFKYLIDKIGSKIVQFRSPKGTETGDFRSILQAISRSQDGKQSQEKIPYLRNMNLPRNFPEVHESFYPLPWFANNDWRSSRLLPKNWLLGKNIIELFVSAPGTLFPVLHIDYWGMDGLVCQIYGEKEFILYHPDDSRFLYTQDDNPLLAEVNPFDPDLIKYPDYEKATPIRIILKPGDILYNPGYWHTTKTLSPSITVITTFWNGGNWGILIKELWRSNFKSKPVKTALTVFSLSLLWIPLYLWQFLDLFLNGKKDISGN